MAPFLKSCEEKKMCTGLYDTANISYAYSRKVTNVSKSVNLLGIKCIMGCVGGVLLYKLCTA